MSPFPKILRLGTFARNVSILAGGTAIGQAIAVIASPVLTRIYTPADFGNYQLYFSILMFAIVAATWRYELAIILPEEDEMAANLLVLAIAIVLAMGVLFAAAAWILGTGHWMPENYLALRPYLWIMPISICGAGIYQSLSYWTLRKKAFTHIAVTKLTQSTSQVGVQLAMGGIFKAGLLGLLCGDAIARFSGSLTLARLAWKNGKNLFMRVRPPGLWQAAVRYRRFPMISLGSALINTAGYAVPTLMLGRFYGTQVLGWFALVDRVLGLPSTLIGQSVAQVYMSQGAELAQRDPEGLKTLFLRTAGKLMVLGILPCLIIFAAAPPLFSWIFGPTWSEAGIYARLLMVMHYVAFAVWPLTQTLNILEEQFWQFLWDIGRLALTASCLWAGSSWGWPPRTMIGVFGAAMLVSYGLHFLISLMAIEKRIKQVRICQQRSTVLPE